MSAEVIPFRPRTPPKFRWYVVTIYHFDSNHHSAISVFADTGVSALQGAQMFLDHFGLHDVYYIDQVLLAPTSD